MSSTVQCSYCGDLYHDHPSKGDQCNCSKNLEMLKQRFKEVNSVLCTFCKGSIEYVNWATLSFEERLQGILVCPYCAAKLNLPQLILISDIARKETIKEPGDMSKLYTLLGGLRQQLSNTSLEDWTEIKSVLDQVLGGPLIEKSICVSYDSGCDDRNAIIFQEVSLKAKMPMYQRFRHSLTRVPLVFRFDNATNQIHLLKIDSFELHPPMLWLKVPKQNGILLEKDL